MTTRIHHFLVHYIVFIHAYLSNLSKVFLGTIFFKSLPHHVCKRTRHMLGTQYMFMNGWTNEYTTF